MAEVQKNDVNEGQTPSSVSSDATPVVTKKSQKPERKHHFGRTLLAIVIVVLIALGVAAAAPYAYKYFKPVETTSRETLKNDGNLTVTSTEDAITNVVDKAAPSVVSIVSSTTTQTIFGAAEQQAAGTGVIVSKDGYILTNNHVIDGVSKVSVVTSDGTTYDSVKIVGSDPLNDIAYLKVSGVTDLKPAELGDSATTRVGQQVVAIGNALGQYQNTVSSGIVSGKGRPITAARDESSNAATESLTDLIQTDAAINPGNSGGPLLNLAGQVIGINTAVAADAQGIGFSIPINATKGTLKSVLAGKGVQRSYLGLRFVEITPTVVKQYDLKAKQGAYIVGDKSGAAVVSNSPADKAGFKVKDIIVSINGEKVGVQGGVSTIIGEYAPGDTVEVTVLRDGAQRVLKVTLGAYPSTT